MVAAAAAAVTSSIEPMDPNWNEEKSWAGVDEEDGIAYRKSFSGKQNLFRVVRLGLGKTKLLYVVVVQCADASMGIIICNCTGSVATGAAEGEVLGE